MLRTALTALVACCAMLAPAAEASPWSDDWAKVRAQAAKEGKDLLLDFTGSDWCPPCMELKERVFDQPEFLAAARGAYVLMEVDSPRGRPLSPEMRNQNEDLKGRYEVDSFPTIILASADGRPFAKTGFRPEGAEDYVRHLASLIPLKAERDRLLAEAGKASGAELAKQLDAALERIIETAGSAAYYDAEIERMIAADADGKAGIKPKWEARKALAEADRVMDQAMERQDLAAARVAADKALALSIATGERRQKLLYKKGAIAFNEGKKEEAVALLKEALAAAPESRLAGQIGQIVQQLSE